MSNGHVFDGKTEVQAANVGEEGRKRGQDRDEDSKMLELHYDNDDGGPDELR